MSAPLTTHILKDSEYDAWNALVAESPQGSVYSTPGYLAALCEAAGGGFRIVAAKRGDEMVGGVAIYERAGGTGLRVTPRPLLYYNGLVLRRHTTKYPSQLTSRILEVSFALEEALSAVGYEGIVLKNRSSFTDARAFMSKGWSARPGYSYVVPIDDLAGAWGRVEQNLRRLVNRCANEGVVLTEDDDFDSFFRMHQATAERKGTALYLPQPAFQRFFTTLRASGLCRLYHARLPQGQSISAQLVLLGPYPVSHSVSAATDPEYMNAGATPFLRWRVFEALSALGYAANDLTDAALNQVAHFKSQLGGNLELCLILEKEGVPNKAWPQRMKSSVSAYLKRQGAAIRGRLR
jgi:hypothetical protein